jgi:RNA polymerase sigma-70 factor (ECF subfamily)
MEPTSTTPERDLVEQAQGGDHRAFAELVCRHDRRLRNLALRLLRRPDRVDDALQEAYVKAFRNIGRFRADASVATWLYRITYNTCLDELRRPSIDVTSEEPERHTPERGPAEITVDRISVSEILATLAPEQRATVVLVDGYGYDYTDVSRLLGVSQGTVASRLNRARSRMREVAARG